MEIRVDRRSAWYEKQGYTHNTLHYPEFKPVHLCGGPHKHDFAICNFVVPTSLLRNYVLMLLLLLFFRVSSCIERTLYSNCCSRCCCDAATLTNAFVLPRFTLRVFYSTPMSANLCNGLLSKRMMYTIQELSFK